ncbi:MAG: TlpA disulfide reductase family protein [Nibricoccus sp.]
MTMKHVLKPSSLILLGLGVFVVACRGLAAGPGLAEVAAKVKAMPGVEIEAEIVSPSVVPITFRISPDGFFYAKYPASEQYTDAVNKTTYFADRQEFSTQTRPPGNPLPIGFDALWPEQTEPNQQVGPTTETMFHDWACYQIPCKGTAGHVITLFVERETLLPRGTRVELKGVCYETVYRTVRVAAQGRERVSFFAPPNARPAGEFNPLGALIKIGARLPAVMGHDTRGDVVSLAELIGPSGKGAVLNFWFSACTECVREMPYLVKLQTSLKNHGIAFVGVNTIDKSDVAQRTIDKSALPFPTIIGRDAMTLAQQAGVKAYPVTLVLNQDMQVVDAVMGFDPARVEKALKSLGVQVPSQGGQHKSFD